MTIYLVNLCTDTAEAGTYHIASAWFTKDRAEAALQEYEPADARYAGELKDASYVDEIEVN